MKGATHRARKWGTRAHQKITAAVLRRASSAARATSVPAVSNVSLAIYVAGHFVCHQRPERSFASCGYQWPVCGRCAGLYLGAAAGVLMTATGTAGALGFAAWAGLDGTWARIRRHAPRTADATA